MPKEKDTVGITLLDVLTNSFAAALLLMTIVAATAGSGDGNPEQQQPGDGTDYVVTAPFDKKKKLERKDPPVLTMLLDFKGPNADRVRLNLDRTNNNITIRQGVFRPGQWSVFRRGEVNARWSVHLECPGAPPDSVYVLITLGNKGFQPLTVAVQQNAPLLVIEEPVASDMNVLVFNQPVPTHYK